jgi:predicted deacylase
MKAVTYIDPAGLPDGSRSAFDLEIVPLADGSMLRLPVNILAGKGVRPCLVLVAGIHGDEPDGILALLELFAELDPANLRGRLVTIPCANPPAFAACRRRNLLDDLDLNRIFPGKPDGLPSERLAHALFHMFISQADFVFSMHGWSKYGNAVPYVEFNHKEPRTRRASFEAAVSSGFDIVRISNWSPGLMTLMANKAGVPGMEAEVGGLGATSAANRQRYKTYARRLMTHLGLSRNDAPSTVKPRIVDHVDLFSPAGGVLNLEIELGREVVAGTRLAVVHDFHGQRLAELIAPDSGMIGVARLTGSVQPGDLVFRLFRDVADPFAA